MPARSVEYRTAQANQPHVNLGKFFIAAIEGGDQEAHLIEGIAATGGRGLTFWW